MKIAQVGYSGFGGLGSVIFSLIGADRQRKHRWSVAFVGDQPVDDSYPDRCGRLGVEFAGFRSTPGRPFRAWLHLARWLEKVRPDAVICHSINTILACRWYSARYNVPLVAVEHTPNQVKSRSERAASVLSMLVANHVVLLSDDYLEELRNAYGIHFRERKVSVIPNGIDVQMFYPKNDQNTCDTRGPIRLGMAARFSFSKRQDLIVGALNQLNLTRPDLDFELVLAGDGSELAEIRRQVAASPIGRKVHFSGLLGENALAPWFRDLDIYVHATDGETLSTSLLQAMASGLPIVASSIPGVVNLIGLHGEFGVTTSNSVAAIAKSVSDLMDNPQLMRSLGERARREVEDRYNQERMLRMYLALLEV